MKVSGNMTESAEWRSTSRRSHKSIRRTVFENSGRELHSSHEAGRLKYRKRGITGHERTMQGDTGLEDKRIQYR